MRFNEIQLKETTEELQELSEFSVLAAEYLFRYFVQYSKNPDIQKAQKERIRSVISLPHEIKKKFGITNPPFKGGKKTAKLMWPIKLSQVPGAERFKTPGLELLKNNATMTIGVFESDTTNAHYDPSDNNILINIDKIYEKGPGGKINDIKNFFNSLLNREEIKKPDYQFIGSAIAHEAQHAIDDFKSRMKFSKDGTLPSSKYSKAFSSAYSKKLKKSKDDEFTQYLKYTHEVNARFAELVKEIKKEIEEKNYQNLDKSQILKLITQQFSRFGMNRAFPDGIKDKNYQKLIKRAYLYLTTYQKDRLEKSKDFDLKSEPKPKPVVAKPIEKPAPTIAPKPQPNYRGSSIYKGVDQAINKPFDYKKLIKSKPYAFAENKNP